MSDSIKLRVPADPAAEFVSQGNFHAELKPKSTIETTNRAFADWLINAYGLTEVAPKQKADVAEGVEGGTV